MNSPATLSIIRTGSANLASVMVAARRLGLEPALIDDADRVEHDPWVILPGVGAFGAAMQTLRQYGIADALRRRVQSERPLLAICLGLQLLAAASDESPGVAGLGLIDAVAERFTSAPRVPQMGWNTITPTPNARLLRAGSFYYANSYRLPRIPAGWEGALTTYGETFVAALERGPILACQFHPELSGEAGHQLLARWVAACTALEPAPC
ncbi:MAG: imidazole glycerol phosphate synthase subunit HisH [Phycisphaerae bacterium]|nr:imidazole glycerol phosphate synthase subunit HisH [Phycisphaerae bacterium]